MKKKKIIVTEENYKIIVLKKMITLCWVFLSICTIISIFGSDIFFAITNNETFIKICNFIDNNDILKILLGILSTCLSLSLHLLAVLQKIKFTSKEFLIVILFIIPTTICRYYFSFLAVVMDMLTLIVLPFILNANWKYILSAFVLSYIFQILSVITKVGYISIIDANTLTSLIMCIDLYIMLVLYYLYMNLIKENKNMGIFYSFLFGKEITELKEMREERVGKLQNASPRQLKKLNKEIEAIDIRIKELEA